MRIFGLVFCILLSVRTAAELEEKDLRRIHFKDVAPDGYDYLALPKINGTPVIVNVSIAALNIRSIDESDMSFTVMVELWQVWDDLRLTFPNWSQKPIQILDSTWIRTLWNPNIHFVNSVEGRLDNVITPSSFFWLNRNRRIFYCCRLWVKLICEMNLVKFPHDEQRCGLKLASAIFVERDLIMQWIETRNRTDRFSSLQQFEILDLEYNKCHKTLAGRNVSCIEETVILRRRSGYFLINVYIPTILIVIMSMLTFWIPHDAVPARVTLGVTSLLTIITKQYQASLPSVSYIVALNVWLSCCIAFVFFSLLEFATVIALSKAQESESLFQTHPDLLLPMVILKANGTWRTKQCWNSSSKKVKKGCAAKRLDFFSRIFFPIAFLIFCVVYWRWYNAV